jgi:Protein of unknown function (DUF3379)
MSGLDCQHVRLAIGGDPRHLPADVQQHLAGCAACGKFRDETLAMEDRLKAALEIPLHRFRQPASRGLAPLRRVALAASVMLAVLVGGASWLLWPQPTLASEIVEHLRHEAGSWEQQTHLPASALAAVLDKAGVQYSPRFPVIYASPCLFRGHTVPHLVVLTDHGPVTVMVLTHEKVKAPETFSSDGYQGELLPAGEGSVALISRVVPVNESDARDLLSGLR